jgi:hypothetical protein
VVAIAVELKSYLKSELTANRSCPPLLQLAIHDEGICELFDRFDGDGRLSRFNAADATLACSGPMFQIFPGSTLMLDVRSAHSHYLVRGEKLDTFCAAISNR